VVKFVYDKARPWARRKTWARPSTTGGLVNAMLSAEAIRTAMGKVRQQAAHTASKVRWGFENPESHRTSASSSSA